MEIKQNNTVRNTAIAAATGATIAGTGNFLKQNIIRKQQNFFQNEITKDFYKSIEQGVPRAKAHEAFDKSYKFINSIAKNGIDS